MLFVSKACFKGSHFVKGIQKHLLKEISPEKSGREKPLFDVKTDWLQSLAVVAKLLD